jgi:hypothetical protein
LKNESLTESMLEVAMLEKKLTDMQAALDGKNTEILQDPLEWNPHMASYQQIINIGLDPQNRFGHVHRV